MCRSFFTYFSCAVVLMSISACSSNANNRETSNYQQILNNDSIPESIKNIVKAVNENDPALFAQNVSYPLQRPYPLKDIQNEEEMKTYYNVIMDDSLRNVILTSTPGDWQRYGWRGYSLKDGDYLWVDESLYGINYLSAKERNMIDSLTKVEIKSLPMQLGTGWTPILALTSDDKDTVYRIDENNQAKGGNKPQYRLAVYDKKKNSLDGIPDKLLNGHIQIEGSATVVSFVFDDNKGNVYTIYPEDPNSGVPTLIMPDESETELSKAYWHELIK